jgi:putative phosphoribosyl transferase
VTFADRTEAGRALGAAVRAELERRAVTAADVVVLALPRGGVPVGAGVADALGVPLDVLVARKIGLPGHAEFGIGAIAEGGVRVLDDHAIARHRVPTGSVAVTIAEESAELARRVQRYRDDRPLPDLVGRTVVLVDDGLATGVTAQAGLASLERAGAGLRVLAVPVAARPTAEALRRSGVAVVVLHAPWPFVAVGQHYEDFTQTDDDEVLATLAARRAAPS